MKAVNAPRSSAISYTRAPSRNCSTTISAVMMSYSSPRGIRRSGSTQARASLRGYSWILRAGIGLGFGLVDIRTCLCGLDQDAHLGVGDREKSPVNRPQKIVIPLALDLHRRIVNQLRHQRN